jgi:hypothetical protein
MTVAHSHSVSIRLLTSLVLACLWFTVQTGARVAAANQSDAADKPAVVSEPDTAAAAGKSASEAPTAADEDPDKAVRNEKYHEKRETELQHAVKEQSEAYLELEKRDEQLQTYVFIGVGALGVVLVGLWLFSRVRKR